MTTLQDVNLTGQQAIAPADSQPPDANAITGRQPTGRIMHDARGNAFWLWAENATNTANSILELFDAGDLQIEGHIGRHTRKRFDAGGGYDPYNSG